MTRSVSRIGGVWIALGLLCGVPTIAQDGALVLEQPALDAEGSPGVPRAGSADGCEQEPHDATFEKALGFNTIPNAANVVQRFAVPVPAGGTEWFLDDVCLTLTRNGSAGTSTFSFAVFRDEGGSPGDVLGFRTVQGALPAFPGDSLCLGDFAVALAGLDAIHVGLAWNPQQQNVFLAMDASPGTAAQSISVRTSTTGPGGLEGWGDATAIDATFRAGGIGITLFESRPEWLTTQISTPVVPGSEPFPRLDLATATRLGGIARSIHGGADLLAINVYQDAAANRVFFSLETPADHPAGVDLEKITKLLNGSRFLGDSILRWPGKPNRFFFTLTDGDRKLLLGLLDVPPAGVDGPVEIDWHSGGPDTDGQSYLGGEPLETDDGEVVVTAPRIDGKVDVLKTTDRGEGEFQRVAQLSPNMVSGSSGALGPAIATIPLVGDVVDCLIVSQAVSAVLFAVRSICGEPFNGPSNEILAPQSFVPHARRTRVLGPPRGPTPEQLAAASVPAPGRPWDALLVVQGNGTIEVNCLRHVTAQAAASRGIAEPGRLELVGQQVLVGVPTGATAEWAVVDTGNTLAPRITIFSPDLDGGVLASTFGGSGVCDWDLQGEESVPGARVPGFTPRRPDLPLPPSAGDADGSGSFDALDLAVVAMLLDPPSGTSLPRQLVAGPPLALFERRVPRPCVSGGGAHCLSEGRFEVAVDWRVPNGQVGTGRTVDLTDDSGLFYFFDPANLELIAKVLDTCGSQFDSHWVFTAGLTDVEYVMRVFDSATGRRRFYVNPLKTAAQPVQDTSAFKPCPALADAGAASTSALPGWARDALAAREDRPRSQPVRRSAVPRADDCTPGATTLCLAGGRFRVEVQWTRPNGSSGDGQSIELTGDTGAFWFFDAANVELLVKVLDTCGSQFDSFWMFAAGLTNVEVVLTVTDTETGASRTYENPLGQPFQPVQDTSAFETCP